MPFEILGHTADIRLKVWGKSLEELFQDALLGMINMIKEEVGKGEEIKRTIKIESQDRTALLIDFLSEALYQSHANIEVYAGVDFKLFSDTKIEAELVGVKVDSFDEDIKGVTHHEAEIRKRDDGNLETIIIFDI